MFGELSVGSLTLPPNSISLAFLSRKDHSDKMRLKVTTLSPSKAPSSPPTHLPARCPFVPFSVSPLT